MKYFKNQKALLFTVEGFDRTGKRTLLRNLKEKFKDDNSIYVYETPDDPNKPDFKTNSKVYQKWLEERTKKQIEDIISLSKEYDIIVKKDLLLSDICFSEYFHRDITVEKYMKQIRQNFTVINIVMLFTTYADYVSRIQKIKQLLKYNILDYKLLVEKFKKYSKRLFNLYGDLYHFEFQRYYTQPSQICKNVYTYINAMKSVLFSRNIEG